jgi:RNA 2',3'-cyclic 3'-phosphodiesterase
VTFFGAKFCGLCYHQNQVTWFWVIAWRKKLSVIRAFIAVDLSPEIQKQLEEVSRQLMAVLGTASLRWTPVKNIHLTLKFLAEVSVVNLEMLKKIMRAEAEHVEAFEVSVGHIGAFPSASRPRVLWAGVQAPDQLGELQKKLESEIAQVGYPPEERAFSPHLTLARVTRTAQPGDLRKIREAIEKAQVGFLGIAPVEAVHLYQSDLRPGGAIYTCLCSAPLHKISSTR